MRPKVREVYPLNSPSQSQETSPSNLRSSGVSSAAVEMVLKDESIIQ